MTYKSPYIWPNKAFPFRFYYNGMNCRIFIIENVHHNFEWLQAYNKKFRASDIFLVYCGWYHGELFALEASKVFDYLKLNRENFYFLFNSLGESEIFKKFGFNGDLINHNVWLDYNLVRPRVADKIYRAVYVARNSPFKRHYLADQIEDLALIMGNDWGNLSKLPLPEHVYRNEQPLKETEVFELLSKSYVGLALSEEEGACFSSSEYLLCDIPVVSTASRGGRDLWYNSYNSIVVSEPTPMKLKRAVDYLISIEREPGKIRGEHIKTQENYRRVFISFLQELFNKFDESIDADQFFESTYFHKLRRSYCPEFTELWP